MTAEAARNLPAAWAKKVDAFLSEKKFRKFQIQRAGDYEKVYEALSRDLTPEVNAKLTEQVRDGMLAHAYIEQLGRARAYLLERWPINQLDTATGTVNLPPSTMQQGQAWALYAILNDPGRILDEMLMGTLLDEQAAAFREVYQGLYDKLRALLDVEIKERIAKSEDYVVPWDRERVMRRLLGMSQEVPIVEAPKGGGQPAAPEAPAAQIDIDFARERPRVIEKAT